MVVPASSTSITGSAEFTNRSISWVSLASERLCKTDLLPDKALIISARLLILFDAGRNEAVPFRTVVRFKCSTLTAQEILFAKLHFVIDFLSSRETNESNFKLDLSYEYNPKISNWFGARFRGFDHSLLTYWKQKAKDKAVHFEQG
jgi:hypothetical protein